jgi:hypothetical protein
MKRHEGGIAARTNGATRMRRQLATIVLLAAPALAASADPEQTPGSNVTVTTCHAQLDKPPLRIAYKNVAQSAATEVDFAIVDVTGLIKTVKDIGKFGSGVPINRVFDLPLDTSPLGLSSARCVVTKVVYADGTAWVNPNP